MLKCDSEYYLFAGLILASEILMFILTSYRVVNLEFGCIYCLCCVPALVILSIITEIRCRKYLSSI